MASFPWDNLITGCSTLIAALGVVGLKSGIDRRDRETMIERETASAREDRRRAAYRELVAAATAMLYNYRQRHEDEYMSEVSAARVADLRIHGEEAASKLFRAIADVEIAGTENARKSAAHLRNTALKADDALVYGGAQDQEGPLADFDGAIGAFIDIIR
jgi:hypothetical protein